MRKITLALLALLLLPLAGCGEEDGIAILRSILKENTSQEILAFEYGDYDGDGTFEAFAFVGEEPDEGDGHAGEIWFVNAKGAVRLDEDRPYGTWYAGLIEIFTFGNRKFVKVEESYATAGISSFWSVRDGKPYKENISGHGGFLDQLDDINFTLEHSALDAVYIDGMLMGRTWKRYWFYWDETSESFREYGGLEISEAQLRKCEGAAEILDEITANGCRIGDILYRANGTINVNYTTGAEQNESNSYTTLLLDGTKVTVDDIYENVGGFYLPALAPGIAVYPDLPEIFN